MPGGKQSSDDKNHRRRHEAAPPTGGIAAIQDAETHAGATGGKHLPDDPVDGGGVADGAQGLFDLPGVGLGRRKTPEQPAHARQSQEVEPGDTAGGIDARSKGLAVTDGEEQRIVTHQYLDAASQMPGETRDGVLDALGRCPKAEKDPPQQEADAHHAGDGDRLSMQGDRVRIGGHVLRLRGEASSRRRPRSPSCRSPRRRLAGLAVGTVGG